MRRNYSICAPATRATLRIAVKHIPGGAFSSFVHEQLEAGDVLEVMTPTGSFCTPLHPLNEKHYVAIAVGSGITPILSMLQTTLEIETESRFTLIYGNRTKDSTMFRRELDELESRHADRLADRPRPRASRARPDWRRIDREKLEGWLSEPRCAARRRRVVPVRADRAGHAHPRHADRARRRRAAHPPRALLRLRQERVAAARAPGRVGDVPLSGREETTPLAPGESILEATLQVRPDAPYACMGGACGTCRAKLVEGTVEMDQNFALGPADLEAGYVLTCQSHPTSACVSVDFDA